MSRNRSVPAFALAGALLPTLLIAVTIVLLVSPSGSDARGPAAVSVGLVPLEEGIADGGLGELAYEGLLRAESELGVAGSVYTPTIAADYEAMVQQCVQDGNDLCISVAFVMLDATTKVAKANPGTSFAIVDVEATVPANNLRGVVFANDEAGYLAGTLAGLMTESGVVGAVGATVGGMHIPAVDAYLVPYGIGAACARLQTTVLVTYTDAFGDPGLGAQVAQQMLNQGTDVIFAAAGPTGNGAILKATQSGAWAIGVDVDQYVTLFQNDGVTGADRLLTSAAKRVDNAVYDTIADVVGGTFSGGTVTYGLAEKGVGLAPWHEAGSQVPQSVRDAVDNIEQGIVNGSIDIYEPCRPTILYLPSVFSGASR